MKTVKFTVAITLPEHMADHITTMVTDKRAPWVILGYILKHINHQNSKVVL